MTPPSSVPITLTFDSVTSAGDTTVTATTIAPPLPPDFQASGTFYDISTTAAFSGLVEVCVPYDPAVFPYYADGATEEERWPGGQPRLLHYNQTTSRWENITTSVNPQNHLVCGTTSSLSPFVVSKQVPVVYTVQALFDETKVNKRGSTVPIKIRVAHNGANVSSSNLAVTALGWKFESSDTSGTPEDAGNANPDFNFRYDGPLQGYIFNLSTSSLPLPGTYRLNLKAGSDQTVHSVFFKVR